MESFLIATLTAAGLIAAVWLGGRLRRSLPVEDLSSDSKESVKLAMGLIATMSALLLGLLVSSAKTSYDSARSEVMAVAAKYQLLDRLLQVYGPQTADVRAKLRTMIEGTTQRLWPDERNAARLLPAGHSIGNTFYVALLKLEAHDDTERVLKSQAITLVLDLGQVRSLMESESTTSISKPMLMVILVWLVIIFLGFSVIAPTNPLARLALVASALCVAGAIFLILELDRPFNGLLRISSEPMRNVLDEVGK